jgi:hypothetical protein
LKRAALAVLALVAACRRAPDVPPPGRIAPSAVERSGAAGRRRISLLYPDRTTAGIGFNVQKGGDSALLVTGWGFAADDLIYWNGKPLVTSVADATQISAIVPKALYATPGTARVQVKRSTGPPQAVSSVFVVASR